MHHSAFRISVVGLLGLIAGVALNIWLFRQGALWGILGLNISKHMVIAYLCQVAGVDRSSAGSSVLIRIEPEPRRDERLTQPI